jgi:Co/Zn/Cd efflux system component
VTSDLLTRHGHRAHDHGHDHAGHGHSHGLVDPSIKRSRAGLRAVSKSLAVLAATVAAQAAVFVATGSVALLADLIHNAGDALTAVPLGAAFLLRSPTGERRAGYFVVLTIFVSAAIAAVESVLRRVNPQDVHHLGALAVAGAIGFIGTRWPLGSVSRQACAWTAPRSSRTATMRVSTGW